MIEGLENDTSTGIKSWVNTQLEGFVKLADYNTKVNEIANKLNSLGLKTPYIPLFYQGISISPSSGSSAGIAS